MQTQKSETPRLGPRIQSWIDAIEPATPEATERNNTRKRPRQQQDNNPRPTKRTTRRALASATGNIMAPPPLPPNRPPDDILRRSERIVAMTPQKSTNRGTQANDEVQEEDTPTPGRSGQGGMPFLGRQGTYPILAPTGAADGMNARSNGQSSPSRTSKSSNDRTQSTEEGSVGGSTIKSGSTQRSSSPIRKMMDFRMAGKKTVLGRLGGEEAREAGGVLDNFPALVQTRFGEGVIPISLKKLVEKCVDHDEWPPQNWYSRVKSDHDMVLGREMLNIWEQAFECERDEVDETTWNSQVHGPLLRLVVNNTKYQRGTMACTSITSARINPKSLSMYNLNGLKMEDKMVDFALVLKLQDMEEEQKVRYTMRDMQHQSMNQTMYSPLQMNPIFLTTETKVPFAGGPTAAVQLITWGSAGLAKLHEMLRANGQGNEPIPTMPLLTFHGHEVHLSAIHEGSMQNTFRGHYYLGSTSTILSLFQLIKALDILVEWGNTEFRDWYVSKVLKSA